ncbi:F-box-like protein, partial [Rhizoctonia solani 123E]
MDSTRARPIDSLPDEILTQIFALACPMHISTWSALGLIPQPSTNNPVILTHVCSYWRRVAIAFSGLWA